MSRIQRTKKSKNLRKIIKECQESRDDKKSKNQTIAKKLNKLRNSKYTENQYKKI